MFKWGKAYFDEIPTPKKSKEREIWKPLQYQLYNLAKDPLELVNLFDLPHQTVKEYLHDQTDELFYLFQKFNGSLCKATERFKCNKIRRKLFFD